MSNITIELLDALLSPDTNHRTDGERHYNSINSVDRIRGCLTLLQSLVTSNDTVNEGRQLLLTVLIRRDIAVIATVTETPASPSSNKEEVLQWVMETFLSILFPTNVNSNQKLQGWKKLSCDVVAESCLSLSILSNTQCGTVEVETNSGVVAIGKLLDYLGGHMSSGDPIAIQILSCIANRAPVAFYMATSSTIILAAILTSSLNTLVSSSQTFCDLSAMLECLTRIGISYTLCETNPTANEVTASFEAAGGTSQTTQTCPKVMDLGNTYLRPLLLLLPTQTSQVLRSSLEQLIDCATRSPSLLQSKDTRTNVMKCMSQIVAATKLDMDIRLSGLEVLATLAELWCANSSSGGINGEVEDLTRIMIDKNEGVIQSCVEIVVRGIDEDWEGWAEEGPSLQDDYYWDGDDTSLHAESLLESLFHSLHTPTLLPTILPLLESLLSSSQWIQMRSGISILERLYSSSPVSFQPYLPMAIQAGVAGCQSPNVRVQFQAVQLLASLCGAQPDEEYDSQILHCMTTLLSSTCLKLVSHACLALVSFCRPSPLDATNTTPPCIDAHRLLPHLEIVLNAIVSYPLSCDVIQKPMTIPVLTRGLMVVACLADVVGEDFGGVYGRVMPGLMGCMIVGGGSGGGQTGQEHDLMVLRGAAMESATIVGQAVDASLFLPDAHKIMQFAMPILTGLLSEYSAVSATSTSSQMVPTDQLLAACARIASVMGEEFVVFVPTLLELLIKRVGQEADVSITDGSKSGLQTTENTGAFTQDDDTGTESITLSLPGMGMKKLTINTTQIQEKSQAARSIYELASALDKRFAPYAETCAQALLPLITFKYSSEVRSTSTQALASVFSAACSSIAPSPTVPQDQLQSQQQKAQAQKLQSILSISARTIILELPKEDAEDTETTFALADALSDLFYAAHTVNLAQQSSSNSNTIALSPQEGHTIVSQLMTLLNLCLEQRAAYIRDAVQQQADPDEEAFLENALLSTQDYLTALVDSVGYILKSQKEAFLPVFESIVAPVFQPLLVAPSSHNQGKVDDIRARLSAICLFDDCVECCGSEAAQKYSQILLQGVMQGLQQDVDDELKRAAVYGVALIARHGPREVLEPCASGLVVGLKEIVTKEQHLEQQDSHEEERSSLSEYALSALASMVLLPGAPFGQTVVGEERDGIIRMFLEFLPLREDDSEAKICHAGLCELLSTGKIHNPQMYTPTLLKLMTSTLQLVAEGEDIATPETCSQFTTFLGQMQPPQQENRRRVGAPAFVTP